MEKMSKISKTVDGYLKVCYWVVVVSVAVFILMAGIIRFGYHLNEDLVHEKWTISVGNMDLELADHVIDNMQVLWTDWTVLGVNVIVGAIISCYGIKLLRKILAPMIQEQPFVGTVSGDLRKLGWLTIWGSIVYDLVDNVGNAIVYEAYDIQNILLSEKIVGVELEFIWLNIETIMLGVLLFLLSHVFCYGEKLQQQDDETL